MLKSIKKTFNFIVKIIKNLKSFNNSIPLYPSRTSQGIRIHLGSGPVNLQGWINIDGRDAPHIHLQSRGFNLDEFSNGSVSEIYMCHVLEHFSFDETRNVLNTMHRKLKAGGVLRLSVPDFDQLIAIYKACGNDLELIKMALMGGQDYEYNFHKGVFNKALLSDLLISCGFNHVQTWVTQDDFGVDLGDWSTQGFDTPVGKLQVSLNLKAIKS